MVFPALLDAGKDRALRDGRGASALTVYVYLLGVLDFAEHRTVKAWAIAHTLRMKDRTAGAALRLLVERGYLDAGPMQNHGANRKPREYRLVWSRARDLTVPTSLPSPDPSAASTGEDADVPASAIGERRTA